MRYIDQLREGMHVSDVYLCKTKQIALTKNGKEYGSLLLQDKTGTVDAKIWDLGSPGIGTFEAMDLSLIHIFLPYGWLDRITIWRQNPVVSVLLFWA